MHQSNWYTRPLAELPLPDRQAQFSQVGTRNLRGLRSNLRTLSQRRRHLVFGLTQQLENFRNKHLYFSNLSRTHAPLNVKVLMYISWPCRFLHLGASVAPIFFYYNFRVLQLLNSVFKDAKYTAFVIKNFIILFYTLINKKHLEMNFVLRTFAFGKELL